MNYLFDPILLNGGFFDPKLILLSYVVAVFASFTALSLTQQVAVLEGKSRVYWLLGGSFSLGIGIWSMHFVGMLAFDMDINFSYDIPLTVASLFVAMVSSSVAILISATPSLGIKKLLIGGLILASGICGMHYTGMEAMLMPATLSYDPLIFIFSLVVAFVVSIAGIFIISMVVMLKKGPILLLKFLAACVIGLAICGMHYTGMAAAIYTPLENISDFTSVGGFDHQSVGLIVAMATFAVLVITLMMSYFEKKLNVEQHVAEQLNSLVKERTEELLKEKENLQRNHAKLEYEVNERKIAEAESLNLSRILEESSNEFYFFEESTGYFLNANKGARTNIQYDMKALRKMKISDIMKDYGEGDFKKLSDKLEESENKCVIFETKFYRKDETSYLAKVNLQLSLAAVVPTYIAIVDDITERKLLETQLAQAQKLESVGQLAAGMAHEINTPIQYISDNIQFIEESFEEINNIFKQYSALLSQAKIEHTLESITDKVDNAIEVADLEYIVEEIPPAIAQSIEGISQVADIVRAMKEFSKPQQKDKSFVDINKAIQTTLVICSNQWKYIAETELNLGSDLPNIPCHPAEINQVLLNIILNAKDSIAKIVKEESDEKGLITISTSINQGFVDIIIKDSGEGVPSNIEDKIFESFFTTKDVGDGMGQGLALAYSIVVSSHHGELLLDKNNTNGAAFIIRLPIEELKAEKGIDLAMVENKPEISPTPTNP